MDFETFGSLLSFCIITTVTPGPNNLIVLTMSVRSGKKGALPAYFGICLGFPLMVLVVSFLSAQFSINLLKNLYIIKFVGIFFLLYVSVKLFFSKKTNYDSIEKRDVSFLQMFLFQWLNPKAWAMTITSLSIIGANNYFMPSFVYLLVVFPCVGLWIFTGSYIKKYIIGKRIETTINKILAVILALSIFYII